MLTKDDILRGLRKMDEKAVESGVLVDLSIYDGAALAIAFDIGQVTRDVDAVVRGAPDFVRAVAAEIAEQEGWPRDWLNDGKGFLSGSEEMLLMQSFPGSPRGGLRIHVPSPAYLFAMKCMAMRPEGLDGSHDISDIEALAGILGVRNSSEALSLIEGFYPWSRIPPKVRFGVEEIMERLSSRRRPDPPSRAPS
jgi:hypothetical protein